MTGELIARSAEHGIVTLTLKRPESANALSRELLDTLYGHLEDLRFDTSARVVIITGAGEKAFCAGADLKERKGMSEPEVRRAVDRIRRTIHAVAGLPQPVIAALNGVAFGGGTELALAADLRIASENARLGLTETSLAIIPGAGGTQRLPRLVGVAKAKELIFTARRINAAEAVQIGLVNEVVAPDKLLARAREVAEEIAGNGPIAVRQAKWAVERGMDVDLATGLRVEEEAYERVIPTNDRLEGLQAFAEKRKPVYRGE